MLDTSQRIPTTKRVALNLLYLGIYAAVVFGVATAFDQLGWNHTLGFFLGCLVGAVVIVG